MQKDYHIFIPVIIIISMDLMNCERGIEYEIVSIALGDTVKAQLYDLGICEKAKCVLVSKGSFNGPIAIKINRTVVAIRRTVAQNIHVKKVKNP